MNIRELQAGDADWIISSHGEVYSTEFGFDTSFAAGIADKVASYYAGGGPDSWVWIAEVEGVRAGSAALRQLQAGAGFVNFVLVLPVFRHQGIAAALMAALLERAHQQGFTSLRLETYSCLSDARELYRKLGFQIASAVPQRAFGQDLVQEFWERVV